MKYNFRQGIQHAPITAGHPSFLTYNPGTNTITVSVGVDLVRASAAYGNVNYLIEERENATEAWGPMVWNASWGPAPVGPNSVPLLGHQPGYRRRDPRFHSPATSVRSSRRTTISSSSKLETTSSVLPTIT